MPLCVGRGVGWEGQKRKETAVFPFSFFGLSFGPRSPLGPPASVYEYVILRPRNSDLLFSLTAISFGFLKMSSQCYLHVK